MTVRKLQPTLKPRSLADLIYEPKTRGLILQVLLVSALLLLGYEIVTNTIANLRKQGIASGFTFLGRTAGFDISQSVVEYKNTMSYGRVFLVGLWNTILVSVLGIVFATILGFIIGIARLSTNWIVAACATVYVEIVRNLPLLLQLFGWYFAVMMALPRATESRLLPFGAMLNRRGLYLPAPVSEPGMSWVWTALLIGIIAAFVVAAWARRRRLATGHLFPVVPVSLALVIGLPLLTFLVTGQPLSFDQPHPGRYNVEGGMAILPELAALLVGLTVYTAAFIAEIVRSGLAGVPRGQREAASALGLSAWQSLRLVVIPQAMRIIIPPLTNQYLNLTKNSSLAVAIGYPDLVSVFAGTVLNQTGQAVEVILITMGVYLALSLLTSLGMNWFNARMALVER